MTKDKDYIVFATHYDWFTVDFKKGYIPTDKAPKEAVEAMERYNKNGFKHHE